MRKKVVLGKLNLRNFLIPLIAGLTVVFFVYAFTGPGSNNPPNGNPIFWLLSGTNMYYNAGNVGIGTSTPSQKLSVAGTIESTSGGFRFPDGTIATSSNSNSGIPSGAIMHFNLSSCPSGWTEATSARGRYIVGLPLSGTLAGTNGTALSNLEDRAVGQHNHLISDPGHNHGVSDPGHSHNFKVTCGLTLGSDCTRPVTGGTPQTNYINSNTTGVSINSAGTGISIQNSGSVAGTNAPYIQFLVCQKN